MTNISVSDFLIQYPKTCDACQEFANKYQTMKEVWDNLPNPQWLLWILDKIGKPLGDNPYRLYNCWGVRNTPLSDGNTVWDLLTDNGIKKSIEVAEKYARGEATEEEYTLAKKYAKEVMYGSDYNFIAYFAVIYVRAIVCIEAITELGKDELIKNKSDRANYLRTLIPNPFI